MHLNNVNRAAHTVEQLQGAEALDLDVQLF